jgi:hypothetical protein
MPEPISVILCMYIMALEFISMAYLINSSLQSVFLVSVYPSIVARQRPGKKFKTKKNTHAIIEELLEAFSVR